MDLPSEDELLRQHEGLLCGTARRFAGCGVDEEDLLQEGRWALVLAARRYDPARGVKFNTYLVWYLRGYMIHLIRAQAGPVRTGTTKGERLLRAALRRGAAPKEAAEALGISAVDLSLMMGRMQRRDVYLDAPLREDARPFELAADGPPPDEQYEALVERAGALLKLRTLLPLLPSRERDVLTARRLNDRPLTLMELGARLGISRERVRQLELRALAELRRLAAGNAPRLPRSGPGPRKEPLMIETAASVGVPALGPEDRIYRPGEGTWWRQAGGTLVPVGAPEKLQQLARDEARLLKEVGRLNARLQEQALVERTLRERLEAAERARGENRAACERAYHEGVRIDQQRQQAERERDAARTAAAELRAKLERVAPAAPDDLAARLGHARAVAARLRSGFHLPRAIVDLVAEIEDALCGAQEATHG